MLSISRPSMKLLPVLLLVYCMASLIHFIHNAEFLDDYPGLPDTWTRVGVYLAWIGLTLIGAGGWLLLKLGLQITGLLLLAVYALLGMDSLGHYVLASFSKHTTAMNLTILLEVISATLVLGVVMRLMIMRMIQRRANPE